MVLNLALLSLGVCLLYLGSEWMVRGAASLALSFSIRPMVVGLTVVAFATSAPELLVSLIAAVKGSSGVSLGNILGSNVANIGLVLGLSAMVKPLAVEDKLLRREIPYMIGVTALFWAVCMDGWIGRLDGFILVGGLGVFLFMGIFSAKKLESGAGAAEVPEVGERRPLWYFFLLVVGMGGLLLGAHLIVESAIFIARYLGLSEVFIGISIVAVGTSLPELATSVVAGARGEHDISIGNVVGSNVFNVCMVIGTVGLLNPMPVGLELMRFEFPAMLFLSLVLFVFSRTGFLLNRLEGFLLLLGYCLFVALSYGMV